MRKSGRKRYPPGLQERQWDLMAGVARGSGTLVSLQDIVDNKIPTLDHSRLSRKQQRALTIARLRQVRDYRILDLRNGEPIGQEQAIRHVRRNTPIGRFLVEVEQEIIKNVREKAGRSRRGAHAGRKRAGRAGGA